MRLLSSRRRHPATRALLLALALSVMGVLYATVAPTPASNADGQSSTQVAEGEALYKVGCASCHGLNAEGTSQGPTLIGVGSASVDFQMGTGRMPATAPGAQIPTKPKTYSDEEIAAIGAYIDSLDIGVTVPKPSQYSLEKPVRSQFPDGHDGDTAYQESLDEYYRVVALGGELFRTNCSACHNYQGTGGALPEGKYAPSLEGVEGKHVWEAMRTGPQQMPVFSEDVISDEEAAAMIAYLNDIHGQRNNGGLTLGGYGPVGEGLWAWIIGIGGLCCFAVWITRKGVRAK
ncbi:MAG TPA: c-type cytochrome [Candidatus Avipropionibacterium avicola]|uniref:Cytochrome bc1 complex cytochrome c subunit n=1 Tax=Candidatus Avipropionibacterium avicola TaxID=2840701 RepID=A0A9D1KLU3_9ACTN|nr:c-type cytochrome [Candidatus Avipropionibacterium avicola]